ncbi:hypothetical protein [Sphingomonas sp. RS2018]
MLDVGFDLSQPDRFLLALLRARYPGRPAPLNPAGWDRAIDVAEQMHPLIFDLRGRRRAVLATCTLLHELGDLELIDGGLYHLVPKVWLPVFAHAFDAGMINRIVYGAATRTILTHCDEKPWSADQPVADRLASLRAGAPIGMMNRLEYEVWRSLPPIVTIYRGGCADARDPAAAAAEMALGLHWTTDQAVAAKYMRGRSYARRFDPGAGLPTIVRATAPRDAVFAYCNNGEHELIVDCARIAPASVIDLGADNYLSKPERIAA